jgi:hypothetical protein
VKLTKCQNHHHHGGVFDTWTKWDIPQAEWTKGLAGRPNSLVDRPGFEAVQPEPWWPCVNTRRRSLSQWRKSVEAAPPDRPTMLLGRSVTTWRQTDFSKSVEVPFTPINMPLTVQVDTSHSFCSSPLVKVLV